MSTDWHVHCVDCNDTHRFDDANHRDDLMLALCRHASAIAGLADALADPDVGGWNVRIETPWGAVDPVWFRQHLGHNMVPIDEYGAILAQCNKLVHCECGASHRCVITKGHSEPCRRKA